MMDDLQVTTPGFPGDHPSVSHRPAPHIEEISSAESHFPNHASQRDNPGKHDEVDLNHVQPLSSKLAVDSSIITSSDSHQLISASQSSRIAQLDSWDARDNSISHDTTQDETGSLELVNGTSDAIELSTSIKGLESTLMIIWGEGSKLSLISLAHLLRAKVEHDLLPATEQQRQAYANGVFSAWSLNSHFRSMVDRFDMMAVFERTGLLSVFEEKDGEEHSITLKPGHRKTDHRMWSHGFDAALFARSKRLFPERRPVHVSYMLRGTNDQFDQFHKHINKWNRRYETCQALTDILDPQNSQCPICPEFERLATAFFNGEPIPEDLDTLPDINGSSTDGPNASGLTSKPKNHTVTYNAGYWSTILRQKLYKSKKMICFLQDCIMASDLEKALVAKTSLYGVKVYRNDEYQKVSDTLNEKNANEENIIENDAFAFIVSYPSNPDTSTQEIEITPQLLHDLLKPEATPSASEPKKTKSRRRLNKKLKKKPTNNETSSSGKKLEDLPHGDSVENLAGVLTVELNDSPQQESDGTEEASKDITTVPSDSEVHVVKPDLSESQGNPVNATHIESQGDGWKTVRSKVKKHKRPLKQSTHDMSQSPHESNNTTEQVLPTISHTPKVTTRRGHMSIPHDTRQQHLSKNSASSAANKPPSVPQLKKQNNQKPLLEAAPKDTRIFHPEEYPTMASKSSDSTEDSPHDLVEKFMEVKNVNHEKSRLKPVMLKKQPTNERRSVDTSLATNTLKPSLPTGSSSSENNALNSALITSPNPGEISPEPNASEARDIHHSENNTLLVASDHHVASAPIQNADEYTSPRTSPKKTCDQEAEFLNSSEGLKTLRIDHEIEPLKVTEELEAAVVDNSNGSENWESESEPQFILSSSRQDNSNSRIDPPTEPAEEDLPYSNNQPQNANNQLLDEHFTEYVSNNAGPGYTINTPVQTPSSGPSYGSSTAAMSTFIPQYPWTPMYPLATQSSTNMPLTPFHPSGPPSHSGQHFLVSSGLNPVPPFNIDLAIPAGHGHPNANQDSLRLDTASTGNSDHSAASIVLPDQGQGIDQIPRISPSSSDNIHFEETSSKQTFICSLCSESVTATPDTPLVLCAGCGPNCNIRYCSVACLLADAHSHSIQCMNYPRSHRVFIHNLPARYIYETDPIMTIDSSRDSPEKFRQKAFSIYCRSGPFPPIMKAWAKRPSSESPSPMVDISELHKRTGDYHVFRSQATAKGLSYAHGAEVIFTIVLHKQDLMKRPLIRALNACFLTFQPQIVQFLYRLLRHCILDNDIFAMLPQEASRDDILQEFRRQFSKEFGLDIEMYDLNTNVFNIHLEWYHVEPVVVHLERYHPVLQYWAMRW